MVRSGLKTERKEKLFSRLTSEREKLNAGVPLEGRERNDPVLDGGSDLSSNEDSSQEFALRKEEEKAKSSATGQGQDAADGEERSKLTNGSAHGGLLESERLGGDGSSERVGYIVGSEGGKGGGKQGSVDASR